MRADVPRFLGDLRSHHLAVADANVLIYHLEGLVPYVDLTRELLTHLSGGALRLVVSVLTAAEVLAGPYRVHSRVKVEQTMMFLRGLPNTELAEVTLPVADRAAWLRSHGLRMPDALVMGTAMVRGVGVVLTNDPAFRRKIPGAPRVLLLDDYCSPRRGS
ncbi:MAG: hypothetical protein A2Z07_07775 [Armatimonadetes bacterium RBG_16_67_12]|nr:MAG: hypothetical protein A2Z07_07775 [Armatimonadetes bacterium RBG_16_67_12]